MSALPVFYRSMLNSPQDATSLREANIEAEVAIRDSARMFIFGSFTILLLMVLVIIGYRSFNTAWTWFAFLSVAHIVVGFGMLDFKSWSRAPGIVFCWLGFIPISLMWFYDYRGVFLIPPIVWGVICLVTLSHLLGDEARLIFSEHYRQAITATPRIRQPTSIVASGCGAVFVVLFILALCAIFFSH